MAQVKDINNYLIDDTIFNKISKRFISMDPDDMKNNNQLLTMVKNFLLLKLYPNINYAILCTTNYVVIYVADFLQIKSCYAKAMSAVC